MMGVGVFEAWRSGEFEFKELSQKYNDPVYGELLRQTPLSDLLNRQSGKVKISNNDFTAGYKESLKEVQAIKQNGEFYEGELNEALGKLEAEREISAVLRKIGLSPSRMTMDDWVAAANSFQDKAFDALAYATEAQREAAGNFAVGRKYLQPNERSIIQVGGQNVEKKWTGGSASAAKEATRKINNETRLAAHEYMAGKLEQFGFTNAADMSYDQQRRLLAKIGKGEAGNVSTLQQAEALEIAYNPRAAKGMKLWEYYEVAMVKAGLAGEIQSPPDNRENYIPGFLKAKKKQQEIDF
jgi:hypothetical protein